jgi:RNA polymerase sigma-70 factor (ECF subfamily)
MNFDRELIVRAKAGESEAQESLVKQFSPFVFRLISRFFRNREDVEDLAQDVFVKIFARMDQVRPDENFPGWLQRVTINTCYDELRKMRRRRVAFETYGPLEVAEPVVVPKEPEDYGRIRQALQALDAKLRVPLILKEVEEMSVEEISKAMGISQTNVKVRLFRARKKLAASLGGSLEEDKK